MATQSGKSRPNARARSAALREQQRKKEKRQRMLMIGGIGTAVVAVIAVMVIIYATKGDKKNAATRQPASPAIVKQVSSVPAADFSKIGAGQTSGGPKKVSGAPLVSNGKPEFFYYGAEYCPYCATERWPVVVALSRFGTWSSLKETTSASQDTPPSISTFSFYGAKFSSKYVSFKAVETHTNQRSGNFYAPLETPTSAEQALVTKYDGPDGSIPFIDYGNKYISSGATYAYQVLQGKSADEIAAGIRDTSSDISKGVLGAANTMTAAVCEMTGGKPGSVCNTPTITQLRATLNSQK